MGASFLISCNACSFSVKTDGPWEFYRDSNGKICDYGHPCPVSEEAAEHGIDGLYANMFCPECGHVSKVVLVEYDTPRESAFELWLHADGDIDGYLEKNPFKCSECGCSELMLEPPDEEMEILCPECKECVLSGELEWVS
jgi:transcription elongation factor Elf1